MGWLQFNVETMFAKRLTDYALLFNDVQKVKMLCDFKWSTSLTFHCDTFVR